MMLCIIAFGSGTGSLVHKVCIVASQWAERGKLFFRREQNREV